MLGLPLRIIVALGLTLLLLGVGIAILYQVQTGRNLLPGFAANAPAWQKVEDSDSRWDYGGNNPNRPGFPYWDIHTPSGNYVLSGGSARACRTDINKGCTAKLSLKNGGGLFNRIRIGFTEGKNRTSADILIDGQKIGEADSYNTVDINDFNQFELWNSPTFTCAAHDITIVPNGRTGTNAKSFDMDFIEILPCSPTPKANLVITILEVNKDGKPASTVKVKVTVKNEGTQAVGTFKVAVDKKNAGGKFTCEGVGDKSAEVTVNDGIAAGATRVVEIDMPTPAGAGSFNATAFVDSTCLVAEASETDNTKTTSYTTKADGGGGGGEEPESFLLCRNYACVSSTTATKDDVACAGLAAGDECGKSVNESCQGNPNAPAKCFDCKRDSQTDSQVNILDFSCFANYYGENVGKN